MNESSNDISYELQQLSGWLYDGRGGYHLGYLLQKLPPRVFMFSGVVTMFGTEPDDRAKELRFNLARDTYGEEGNLDWIWIALYGENCPDSNYKLCLEGDMAENAICKLAIALFEQGVLKK